ncbi:ribonuclease H-like domain-containing protein [Tanacetum coccineum]
MKSRSVTESVDADYASDTEHLTFFDNQTSQSPNDDGRATPVEDGSDYSFRHNGTDTTTSSLCQEENSAAHFGDQSSSKGNLFQNSPGQPLSFNENNFKYGQTPGVRRSSRQTKLPVKLNDYVLNSNVKYGIEKFVSYSSLKGENLCFATTLNKSIEPTCLSDASSDLNWVDAMNNEIEALNRNNTWTECDLPPGRKLIESKWIWKIKYKTSRDIERYKARLVAKGLARRRLDVNNAFLYDDLNEDVYMTLPDDYNSQITNVISLIKLRVAFHAINACRLPLAPLVYTLVRPPMTTSVVNNSVFKGFFEKQKLSGPNFIDWYRQLRIVRSVEDKLNYLEHPIPAAPVPAQAGQQVAPKALATHAGLKDQKRLLDSCS